MPNEALLNVRFVVVVVVFVAAGDFLCDHFLHVCLCVLHCLQNAVLQLLLLCTKASDRPK